MLDGEGRPLAGATIRYRAGASVEPSVTHTGEDGRFSSGDLSADRFDVLVHTEGYAFWVARELDPSSPLKVTLVRGSRRSGRVLAETTGEGIPGARVRMGDSEAFDLAGPELDAVTDNEGRYHFAHAPAGTVWVRATAAGWATRATRVRAADVDDLWLPEGGRISGRVVDERAKPIGAARVWVAPVDGFVGGLARRFPVIETRTDDAGHFALEGVTAGTRYRVVARSERFAQATAGPFTIDAGTDLGKVTITLHGGATLRFRLTDPEDRPATRATVRLIPVEDETPSGTARRLLASTEDGKIEADQAGWLTLPRVTPGTYAVYVEPDGWVEIRRGDVVLSDAETTDLGTIKLMAGSTVAGRVTTGDGKAVVDGRVEASWRDLQGKHERRAATDDAGRFAIAGLPGFPVTLSASAEGFATSKPVEVEPDAQDVGLTLPRPGGIRGRVKAVDGGDLPTLNVRAVPSRGSAVISPRVEISSQNFQIFDLDPGSYTVEVRSPHRAPARVEKVNVRPGAVSEIGEVTLRPGRILRGRVVIADGGASVTGATIRVDRGPGPTSWSGERGEVRTISDAQGRFEFDQLAAGRYTLTLFHPDFAPVLQSIEIDPEVETTDLEILLKDGGEIRGSVIDRDGLPVVGADVWLGRGVRGFDSRMASTRDDGTFRFSRLAAGTYVVIRHRSREGYPFAQQVRTVELREGEVKVVKFSD